MKESINKKYLWPLLDFVDDFVNLELVNFHVQVNV
jgi:hypothetical protein